MMNVCMCVFPLDVLMGNNYTPKGKEREYVSVTCRDVGSENQNIFI